MKTLDIFDALRGLKEIGYDAVEITVARGWPTEPARLDAAARRKLAAALQDLGFPPAPLMAMVAACVPGADRPAMLTEFAAACELAKDLNFVDRPAIVTSTLGGKQPDWNTQKHLIRDSLIELADIGAARNVIFAVEPHVGGSFDTPEKAAWMMDQTRHEFLKLNFDYSHFFVKGMDLKHCVDLCLKHAVHTHIKDGWMTDKGVKFVLPGEGKMDLTHYMRVMREAGAAIPITVEVSGMVWNAPQYDPWAAARSSFKALDAARRAAFK
jgi:sugar phosphate isomerase/epimerase